MQVARVRAIASYADGSGAGVPAPAVELLTDDAADAPPGREGDPATAGPLWKREDKHTAMDGAGRDGLDGGGGREWVCPVVCSPYLEVIDGSSLGSVQLPPTL